MSKKIRRTLTEEERQKLNPWKPFRDRREYEAQTIIGAVDLRNMIEEDISHDIGEVYMKSAYFRSVWKRVCQMSMNADLLKPVAIILNVVPFDYILYVHNNYKKTIKDVSIKK